MSVDRLIPLTEPYLHGNERRYVEECLNTNWVSSAGPFVERFEQMVAARAGTRYAVAVSSGTAALHVALLLAGIANDDEVIVPALTFIAPANAVRYVGGWPVFVDVDERYWQLDVQKTREFIEQCDWKDGRLRNKATGRRVRAILVVDVLGHPVDADPLKELAAKYGLVIIEDATESLGATYKGRPVGTLGDIACFSFNGNKIVTAGGGGVIATDDAQLAGRAFYLTTQAKDDDIEYIHHAIGFNYRLTNIQAALGAAQLERLDDHVAAKRRIAARYAAALGAREGLEFMHEAPWAKSTFWLSTVLVHRNVFGCDSRELLARLAAARIQSRPLWQPLHRSRAHAGAHACPCEVADRLFVEALSLPSSVGLALEDQERVINAVAGVAAQ